MILFLSTHSLCASAEIAKAGLVSAMERTFISSTRNIAEDRFQRFEHLMTTTPTARTHQDLLECEHEDETGIASGLDVFV